MVTFKKMYEAFYGLNERPFHVTADPAFLYLSRHHQEALDHLTYGIRERLGFLLITGEVGTGKTTLAKALVEKLEVSTKTALILHPTLTRVQLLRAILKDFGAPPNGLSRGHLVHSIEEFLLKVAQEEQVGVLIVDEAQALPVDSLEQVRLLSNVETPKRKLLQIVLVGQPELENRLEKNPRLRALNQRIAIRYRIRPLDQEEVASYISHRLLVAGAGEFPRFTEEALSLIVQATEGIPRRINLLCDRVLLAGFVHESKILNGKLVEEVLQ